MSTSLFNGLIQQIMHSEEKVRERCNKLRALNDEIQSYENKIQDGKEEINSLQGELVMENQCLVDEELSLKWFTNREQTPRQKLLELNESKKVKETEMEELEERSDLERNKFEKETKEFVSKYDLAGQGQKKRDFQLNEKLNLLKEKAQNLTLDLEEAKQKKKEAEKLRVNKVGLEETVANMKEDYRVLSCELAALKNHSKQLEKEKEKATNKKENDQEFRRLAAELESLKNNNMESVCEALSQELSGLQQVHLTKQLQKQKVLQKRQQQQYKAQEKQWSYGPPVMSTTGKQANQNGQKNKKPKLSRYMKGKQWRREANHQTQDTNRKDNLITTVDLTEDDMNDYLDDDFIDDTWI